MTSSVIVKKMMRGLFTSNTRASASFVLFLAFLRLWLTSSGN